MSLKVQQQQKKNIKIFRDWCVMHVGSGGTAKPWKILDFERPKHSAILVTKRALKYKWKSSITITKPRKSFLKLWKKLKEMNTAL